MCGDSRYTFSWATLNVIAGWIYNEVKWVVLHVEPLLLCVGFLKKQQVLCIYGDSEDPAVSDRKPAPFIDAGC